MAVECGRTPSHRVNEELLVEKVNFSGFNYRIGAVLAQPDPCPLWKMRVMEEEERSSHVLETKRGVEVAEM